MSVPIFWQIDLQCSYKVFPVKKSISQLLKGKSMEPILPVDHTVSIFLYICIFVYDPHFYQEKCSVTPDVQGRIMHRLKNACIICVCIA